MKKRGLVLFGIACMLSVSACGKKEDVVETSQVQEVQESTEEGTESTLETDVGEVKETVVGIGEVSKEDSINIDEIIKELSEDVKREEVDLGEYTEDVGPTPNDIKRQADTEFEESLRESLGITQEESIAGDEEGVSGSENTGNNDFDDNPNTREIPGFESNTEETEPEIDENGAVVDTIDDMIERSKENAYEGPSIDSNNSEEMSIGRVYNYYLDDGTEIGQVGDYVMCGKLAINVSPNFAIPGYTLKSYGNTVEINTDLGNIYIKKLDTDVLEVEKMSASQISRLSGLNVSSVYMNATKGSFSAYSMCMIDELVENGVQYYKCGFGTYELKYESNLRDGVIYLIAAVKPESSLNAIAVDE